MPIARDLRAVEWESSVILAHLKREPDRADYLPALDEAILKAVAGEMTLCASAIMTCEVREADLPEKALEWLRGLKMQPWFVTVAVDVALIQLAGDVRDESKKRLGKMLSTRDAIFVASTIVAGCGQLWTFDGRRASRPKDTSPKLTECHEILEPWRPSIRLPGIGQQMTIKHAVGTASVAAEGHTDEPPDSPRPASPAP